jgi:hypothetical protein
VTRNVMTIAKKQAKARKENAQKRVMSVDAKKNAINENNYFLLVSIYYIF